MEESAVGYLILFVCGVLSYKGLKDHSYFERYKFHVGAILGYKEYYRLFSSGFLHADFLHFAMNMYCLLVFSAGMEREIGVLMFSAIYFGSLLGGGLLSLFLNRNNANYSSIGASGAVSGIVFSYIMLYPDIPLGILFIPLKLPAWIFGSLYMLFTLFGIKKNSDGIGHAAHLGGALTGILLIMIIQPKLFLENYILFFLFVVPTLAFILVVANIENEVRFQGFLNKLNSFFSGLGTKNKASHNVRMSDKKKERAVNSEVELNRILDKIKDKGLGSLSEKEKKRLDQLSK